MNSSKYFFLSDVHLGLKSKEIEKEKEKKLIRFLDHISSQTKKIFIVGDLFDCWIEYRKVVPKGYYKLLSKLNDLVEHGIEIHFLSGNHDFWLNTYLRDDVGLILHYNELVLTIDDKKFYLIHGDGLSKNDLGYKILKKILRSKINQFLYSLIHPDIGISIAQGSSKTSRIHTVNKESNAVDGMIKFASMKISEGYDYVIMGHYHHPKILELNGNNRKGYFITLGDWIKHYSFGIFQNGEFQLNYWKS